MSAAQRIRGAALLLGALLGTGPGCSALFVSGPSAPPAPPSCTTVNVFPAIDTVFAVVLGTAGAILLAVASDDDVTKEDRTVLRVGGVLYGGSAVGMALSASSGFDKTRRCRRRYDQERAAGGYGAPRPYPYPPAPQPYPYAPSPYAPSPYPPAAAPQPSPYAPSPYPPSPYAPPPRDRSP